METGAGAEQISKAVCRKWFLIIIGKRKSVTTEKEEEGREVWDVAEQT